MVALVGLLKEWKGLPLTDYEIAELAHEIERVDLGIAGGMQDQYAAAFGGVNFIEFLADRVVVNSLRLGRDILNELEYNLLLVDTGKVRLSSNIIDDQVRRYERARDRLDGRAARRSRRSRIEMKDRLLHRKWDDFGRLLDEEWQHKKRMSDRISSPELDDLYRLGARRGCHRRQDHGRRRRRLTCCCTAVRAQAPLAEPVAPAGLRAIRGGPGARRSPDLAGRLTCPDRCSSTATACSTQKAPEGEYITRIERASAAARVSARRSRRLRRDAAGRAGRGRHQPAGHRARAWSRARRWTPSTSGCARAGEAGGARSMRSRSAPTSSMPATAASPRWACSSGPWPSIRRSTSVDR